MASSHCIRDLLHEHTRGMFNPEEEEATEAFCDNPELVSVICPTSAARHRFHPFLYRCFCRQTYMPCEMIVVDVGVGASARSKFFTSGAAAADPRVKYRYFDVEEKDKLWSIGTRRNVACYLAHGYVIVHFDDDDNYMAEYVEWVLQALRWGSVQCDTKVTLYSEVDASRASCLKWGDFFAGAVTLSRWYIFDLRGNSFFNCDPESERSLSQRRRWILGYGFSYAYLRELWCMYPFQDVNLSEDFMFMKTLLDNGWQVALLRDTVGFCAHTIHQSNTSGMEAFIAYEFEPPQGLIDSSRLLVNWVTNPNSDEFPVDRHIRSSNSIMEEITRMFVTEAFQKEIRDAAQSARTPAKKEGNIKMICIKYQIPIMPKYGLPASMRGVVDSLQLWSHGVILDPEIALKHKIQSWLISPDLQDEKPLQEFVPGLKEEMREGDCLAVLVAKAFRLAEELGLRLRGPLPSLLSHGAPTQHAENLSS